MHEKGVTVQVSKYQFRYPFAGRIEVSTVGANLRDNGVHTQK